MFSTLHRASVLVLVAVLLAGCNVGTFQTTAPTVEPVETSPTATRTTTSTATESTATETTHQLEISDRVITTGDRVHACVNVTNESIRIPGDNVTAEKWSDGQSDIVWAFAIYVHHVDNDSIDKPLTVTAVADGRPAVSWNVTPTNVREETGEDPTFFDSVRATRSTSYPTRTPC